MRYVAVQIAAYAIDLGIFVLVFHAALAGPIAANVIAKIAAGAFAFWVHRAFTFRVAGVKGIRSEAAKYALLLGLNIPVASGLLALLMLAIPSATTSKIIADVICVGLTFLATKHGVFGTGTSPGGKENPPAATGR